MEERRSFFTDHYGIVLIVVYIALMAMVIFFLAVSTALQIALFIASAVVLVWMLRQHRTDDPPCGSNIGGEGIDRPRAGHSIPVGPQS
jgi:membrane protein implicated in regulation of membrane protease activity